MDKELAEKIVREIVDIFVELDPELELTSQNVAGQHILTIKHNDKNLGRINIFDKVTFHPRIDPQPFNGSHLNWSQIASYISESLAPALLSLETETAMKFDVNLNTTTKHFLKWLRNTSSKSEFRKIKGDAYLITLQNVRQAYYSPPGQITMVMDGHTAGPAYAPLPEVMSFGIVEHKTGSIKVTIQLFLAGPAAKEYLKKWHRALARDYPEIKNETLTAQPTTQAGDDKQSNPWDDTELKLEKLRAIRKKSKQTTQVIGWIVACEQAGIDPKTAKKHDPELRKNWYDKEF